jgi:nicotinamide-nucleotide amidase
MKKLINAEILAIGDELLYGQTLDTNSHWISAELDKVSIKVVRRTTVGDQEDQILQALKEAEQRAQIILITGGLGPTSDDLTKPCLAKYFNCEVAIHEQALIELTEFFKSRGRELTETNRQQAMLPVCCTMISNPMGTAAGMWFEKDGKVFVSMPGVPHEMKHMMTNTVIPKLTQLFETSIIYHKVIRTAGIGESFLADKIKPWETNLPPHIKLAYLPSLGEVKLRLTAIGDDKKTLQQEIEKLVNAFVPLAGEYIYGFDEDPLEVAIGKILRENKLTLSIAESCTGGYVSHLITSVPGSSDYFQGSIIPYSYEIKMQELGVQAETLTKYGAVSEQTIKEMATLVRKKFNTSIGIATSGIAGPGGATLEKPVGTVWLAYADENQVVTRKLQLSKDRLVNIKMSSVAVLNLVRQNVQSLIGIKA